MSRLTRSIALLVAATLRPRALEVPTVDPERPRLFVPQPSPRRLPHDHDRAIYRAEVKRMRRRRRNLEHAIRQREGVLRARARLAASASGPSWDLFG